MKLSKHKIFISGGAGVIGQELVKILYNEGAELFIGDLKKKPKSFKDDIVYRQGDLNHIKEEELIDFNPDIFIHLAATFERTEEKKDFFEKNFWHNLKLSNKLLGILYKQKNIKQIIFASSYLVYNDKNYISNEAKDIPYLLKENSEILPRNLVGMAKLCHEIEIDFLNKFKSKKSNFISVRIFRGFGKGSKDIISRWVRSLLNKEKIHIFDSENIFDFIYAKDTAKGIFSLINSNFQGAINLGSGKSTKISDIIKSLRKKFPLMKTKYLTSKIKFEASEADISLLKKITGWKPKYKIEKAISEIIDYEKNIIKFSSSNKTSTFLLTSSSSKYPLIDCVENSIKKIDANIKILLGDKNTNTVSRYHQLRFLKMPETLNKNKYKVLDYCITNNVKYVLPTRDAELEFWSQNIDIFKKNGINVFVSPVNYIRLCRDKLKFSQFCKKNKFNVINSYLNLDKISMKKIVVKERFGSGSKHLGINLSKKKALIFSKKLKQPIFQKYITGKEISIDVWISKNNELKGTILRYRNLVIDGESKISTTFENTKIENCIEKFVKKFKFNGFICIQGMIDNENQFKIIECNPRIGGASTLSIKKGLDGICWSILESNGQNLKNYKFLKDNRKIKLIRYQKDKYIYGNNF